MGRVSIILNGADVTDYVISCDEIPRKITNRDFTLSAAGFSMKISGAYTGDLTTKGVCYVYADGTRIFWGDLDKADFQPSDKTFEVSITPVIKRLQNKKVTYANLHSDLGYYAYSDASKYKAFGEGHTVQMLHLIGCLLRLASLSVHVAGASNPIGMNITYGGNSYAVKYSDIYLSEGMIYAIGQNSANLYRYYNETPDTNFIDCFELLNYLLSSFNLTCYYGKPSLEYCMHIMTPAEVGNVSIQDNLIFDQTVKTVDAQSASKIKQSYCEFTTNYYDVYSATTHDLNKTAVAYDYFPSNLRFYINLGLIGQGTGSISETYVYDPIYATSSRRMALEQRYRRITTVTDINFSVMAKEVYFDIEKMQTKYVQEVI